MNLKKLIPIILIGATQVQANDNTFYKLSLSHSTEGKTSPNIGLEVKGERDSYFSPYGEIEIGAETIDFLLGFKPTDADNFCPYLGAGFSSQTNKPLPRFALNCRIGLEKYLEESKALFAEYELNGMRKKALSEEPYQHTNQFKFGFKGSF